MTSPDAPLHHDASPPDEAEAQAWLDAIAGRGGSGNAAREGAALGEALRLASVETGSTPAWSQIEQRAAIAGGTKPAANSAWFKPQRLATAAVLVMLISGGMWLPWRQQETEQASWRGGGAAARAQWRVADPKAQAARLAEQLRHDGAVVEMVDLGASWQLRIQASPAAANFVNARLIPLEAALDTRGSLILEVAAPKP